MLRTQKNQNQESGNFFLVSWENNWDKIVGLCNKIPTFTLKHSVKCEWSTTNEQIQQNSVHFGPKCSWEVQNVTQTMSARLRLLETLVVCCILLCLVSFVFCYVLLCFVVFCCVLFGFCCVGFGFVVFCCVLLCFVVNHIPPRTWSWSPWRHSTWCRAPGRWSPPPRSPSCQRSPRLAYRYREGSRSSPWR